MTSDATQRVAALAWAGQQAQAVALATDAIRANMKLLTFDRSIGQLLASDAERRAYVLTLA